MINTHMKADEIAPQGSFLLPCRPHLNKDKVAKDSAKGGSSTSKSNFFFSNKSKIPLTSTGVTLLIIIQSGQERFLKIVPFLLEAFRRSHYVCLLVKHPKENKNGAPPLRPIRDGTGWPFRNSLMPPACESGMKLIFQNSQRSAFLGLPWPPPPSNPSRRVTGHSSQS